MGTVSCRAAILARLSPHTPAFGGTIVSLPLLAVPAGTVNSPALLWGTASGLGTGIGVAFLYRAMHNGAISVVVPISDVGAVCLPVLAGLLFLRERPSLAAWGGVIMSLPAIWMVSRGNTTQPRSASGVPDALIAGAGFGLQFIGMGQVPAGTGWWPIVISRVTSVLVILVLVTKEAAFVRLRAAHAAMALSAGAAGTVAIILYFLAAKQQLMTIVVVLSALYPAIPVLLALIFLGERLNRTQAAGLACAAAAIALLSAKY